VGANGGVVGAYNGGDVGANGGVVGANDGDVGDVGHL
jgi:hypothetical protein